MKKLHGVLGRDTSAAIGIGTMIIFIAMVLVAGIAASVLIQTSARLESQAMATGQETTSEVATGLSVESVVGYAADSEDLKYLAVEVRPRSGSQGIDLSETLIELSDSNVTLILTYQQNQFTAKGSINGNTFTSTFYDGLAANEFSIVVLEDADGSCVAATPVINRGDKVLLTIDVGDASGFNQIAERTDIYGSVIPEEGSPGIIAFRTPASYSDNIFDLQ